MANSSNITPTQLSYLSGLSSNVQAQLNNLQPLLSNVSNLTVGSLSCSGIVDSSSLSCTALTCSSETDSALFTVDKISENLQAISTGSNSYTLNYSNGAVFYINSSYSPTANFTIQINNVGSSTTQTIVWTVIYKANYIPSTILVYSDNGSTQITLSSSTPLYSNQTTPSISGANICFARFCLHRMFSSNYCTCDVVFY